MKKDFDGRRHWGPDNWRLNLMRLESRKRENACSVAAYVDQRGILLGHVRNATALKLIFSFFRFLAAHDGPQD